MKILIVGDTYYPHVNGCSYFTQRLAHYKQKAGHEVAVVAPSRFLNHTDEVINDIRVFGISSLPTLIYKDFRFAHPVRIKAQMKKILDTFQPDVIHFQSHFTVNRAMWKVAKKRGIPMVATNHFMPDNLTHYLPLPKKVIPHINEYMWRDFAKMFGKVPFVSTPTEIAANLIRPRLGEHVVSVTCGIDLEKFNPKNDGTYLRERYNIPDGKPVLLYVGRLDAEKRVDHVLHAVKDALEKVDFTFVVGGMGFERKNLENLAHKLGISKNVVFSGFVPDEDLPYLYTIADCFVNACTVELQCIVAMEAMASGLPVIAVRAGALPELIKDGVSGMLFEPGDHEMLVKQIIDMMSHKEKREKMGAESLKIIAGHSIDSMVSQYLEMYEKARSHAKKGDGKN